MFRTVPAASGHIFAIPVEVHVQGSLGRAAVALHEFHDLADALFAKSGDPMAALASAADELIKRLADEHVEDVSVAIGMTISPSARLAVKVSTQSPETVLALLRGTDRINVATSSYGPQTDRGTASRATAAHSLVAARLALGNAEGRYADDTTDEAADNWNALVVSRTGTIYRSAV